MGAIVKRVPIGLENVASVDVTRLNDSGVLESVPLDAVTRIITRLENRSHRHVVDSDDDSTYMDWRSETGKIIFKIGLLPGLTEGKYGATIIVYDLLRPQGQALTHSEENEIFFEVYEVEG